MSRWLAEKASAVLAARSSRRGFLYRSAVVGSALATNPIELVTRPVSAYAAVCECRNQPCACGTLCCDGYTSFCCSLTGSNSCPQGTILGGWWKADGSGFCGDAPRYYMDCNVIPGNEGVCYCHCSGDDCNNRVECCSGFRYGQCHQEFATLGRIYCRVVTCTPPWVLDPSCTTTSATDQATAFHDAPCLSLPATVSGPRTMRTAWWYLAPSVRNASALRVFPFGNPGDIPLLGDWNGDGFTTPGVRRGNTFYLSNSWGGAADHVFNFGDVGDIPIVGDWTGKGFDSVGVVRKGLWYLRNAHSSGPADITFAYGNPDDVPVVGRWVKGAKATTPGVFRRGAWFLRNTNSTGTADIALGFGNPTDVPVVGDWDGDGQTTVGVVRGSAWYVTNSFSGADVIFFGYGNPGDIPLVGRFDVPDVDGPGVAR